VEKLQRGEITDLPSHVPDSYNSLDTVRLLQAKFGIFVVHGLFLIKEEDALNSTFPEIQTTTVESVLSVWKGK
jgi:hypothetical protein